MSASHSRQMIAPCESGTSRRADEPLGPFSKRRLFPCREVQVGASVGVEVRTLPLTERKARPVPQPGRASARSGRRTSGVMAREAAVMAPSWAAHHKDTGT